jgi:phage protein D
MPVQINEITITDVQPTLVSQITIQVNGNAVQEPVMARLARVIVDQNVHLPGMFVLRFHDPDLELINRGPFDLTQEVVISTESSGENITLIQGEITALEPAFGEGMIAELVVRGYDRSHRLFRETRTCAYLNTKDSDLASQIAQNAGLQSEVETTQTVYDHIFQHNQTDLDFLAERAWRIGYECFISEGKLFFRRPPDQGRAARVNWGEDLVSFLPRVTLAEQVDEVVVRGWDMQQQQPIIGRSQNGMLYPQNGEQQNGASWAHRFGAGRKVIVDQPVVSQAEADTIAAARMNEISGAFIQADGVVYRRPDVQAGRIVDLQALGARFSGKYLVTSATHTYSPSGMQTNFRVRGLRSGLFSEGLTPTDPGDRWPGIVIGVVTNNEDPQTLGRVKVKFPWMSEDAESDWARVIAPGASAEKGLAMIPAVGDEVAVAFEQGHFSRPFVLGGLWNGQSSLPPQVSGAQANEKHKVLSWNTAAHHHITLYDTQDNKIEIVTAGGRSITLSDADSKITLKTSGVEFVLEDSKLSIKAQSEVNIEASSNLKLSANGNIEMRASGMVNINGSTINLNS